MIMEHMKWKRYASNYIWDDIIENMNDSIDIRNSTSNVQPEARARERKNRAITTCRGLKNMKMSWEKQNQQQNQFSYVETSK